MKKGKKNLFIISALVIFFGSYFMSQWGVDKLGPSEQKVEKLFLEYFSANTPTLWRTSGAIQKVEISQIKVGPSLKNEAGEMPFPYFAYENCWPVSMHVNASTKNTSVFDGTVKHFDVCSTNDGRQIVENGRSVVSMK